MSAVKAPQRNLLSIEEAQELVLRHVEPLPSETIRVDAAVGRVLSGAGPAGRVLSEWATSAIDLPRFDSSAMDGFAIRSEDTPGTLPVPVRIAAGSPADRALAPGEAMGIATGGAVPEGADAVIPLEYVVDIDNTIEIAEAVKAGANIRLTGGDLRQGSVVVEAGVRLGAAQMAALSAAGVAEVRVSQRPRAAVLATGSELRRPGEPLEPGQIYEANGVRTEVQL